MKHCLILVQLLIAASVGAQVHLERQVIGSAAVNGTGSVYLSSTLGQVPYTTVVGITHQLTQGFEQPSGVDLPEVQFSFSYSSCEPGASLQIDSQGGCLSGELSITANNLPFSAGSQWLEPGNWTLVFSSGSSCTVSYQVTVLEEDLLPCPLVIYNMLTPNNDQLNDIWFIENIDDPRFSSNRVEIFNRWGQLVWEGDNYDNSTVFWDGKNQDGSKLPDGTFFYSFRTDELTLEGFIELKY